MNKKRIIIGGIILLLLLVIVMIMVIFKTSSKKEPTTQTIPPYISGDPLAIPTDNPAERYIPTITLAPKNGKVVLFDVPLDDFTPLVTKTPGSKISIIKESFSYTLEYKEDTGFFYINFKEVPTDNDINQAETDLLQILGIDKDNGCRQSIEVLVPSSSDPSIKNPRALSFCDFEGDTR